MFKKCDPESEFLNEEFINQNITCMLHAGKNRKLFCCHLDGQLGTLYFAAETEDCSASRQRMPSRRREVMFLPSGRPTREVILLPSGRPTIDGQLIAL